MPTRTKIISEHALPTDAIADRSTVFETRTTTAALIRTPLFAPRRDPRPKNGGNWPSWRDDQEIRLNLFPVSPAVLAVPVKTGGAAFVSGVPQRLPLPPGDTDAAPGGQRFVVALPQDPGPAYASIRVVLNWPALLRK